MHAVLASRNNNARRQAFRDAGCDVPRNSRIPAIAGDHNPLGTVAVLHDATQHGVGQHSTVQHRASQNGAVLVQDIVSDVTMLAGSLQMPRYSVAHGNPFSGPLSVNFHTLEAPVAPYPNMVAQPMPVYVSQAFTTHLAKEHLTETPDLDALFVPGTNEMVPPFPTGGVPPEDLHRKASLSKKHRFVNESLEHLNLFHACRRHFARYFSITDHEASILVSKYCGIESPGAQDTASRCLERWRINWQTKLIRDLKEHLIKLSKTNPEVENMTWDEAQDFFTALFSDAIMMRDAVFSSLTAVVDIVAIINDDGLARDLYKTWYQNICWFMIQDMGKIQYGKWATSTVFSRQLYEDFRGIARDDKFKDLEVDDIPMPQENGTTVKRMSKKRTVSSGGNNRRSSKRPKKT